MDLFSWRARTTLSTRTTNALDKVDEILRHKKAKQIVLVQPFRPQQQPPALELRYNQLDLLLEKKAEQTDNISLISLTNSVIEQDEDVHPTTLSTTDILHEIQRLLEEDLTLDQDFMINKDKYRRVQAMYRVGCPTCWKYDRRDNTDYCEECTINKHTYNTEFENKRQAIAEKDLSNTTEDWYSGQMESTEETPASQSEKNIKRNRHESGLSTKNASKLKRITSPPAKPSKHGLTGSVQTKSNGKVKKT